MRGCRSKTGKRKTPDGRPRFFIVVHNGLVSSFLPIGIIAYADLDCNILINEIFNTKRKTPENQGFLVDATGFEPATSASRTQRSTKLSHASLFNSLFSTANSFIIHCHFSFVKSFFDFSRLFCNYSSRHSGFPHLTLLYRPLRAIRPLRIRHLFM